MDNCKDVYEKLIPMYMYLWGNAFFTYLILLKPTHKKNNVMHFLFQHLTALRSTSAHQYTLTRSRNRRAEVTSSWRRHSFRTPHSTSR